MKTVIIVGHMFDHSNPAARFPGAEVWCQSKYIRSRGFNFDGWTRWFDPHEDMRTRHGDVVAWYEKQPAWKPIYLPALDPKIPAGVRYPFEFVNAHGRLWSGFDYMMALAMAERFERIVLSGVGAPMFDNPNLGAVRNWTDKHKGLLYWIGFAEAADVDVKFDGPCLFTPTPQNYGATGYDPRATCQPQGEGNGPNRP